MHNREKSHFEMRVVELHVICIILFRFVVLYFFDIILFLVSFILVLVYCRLFDTVQNLHL
jgi:hypothetical protein